MRFDCGNGHVRCTVKEFVEPKLFYGSDSRRRVKHLWCYRGVCLWIRSLTTPLISDEDQEKQHVRICVKAEGETGNMLTISSSESILSEAAVQLMSMASGKMALPRRPFIHKL